MRIYLSAPISSDPDGAYKRFDDLERRARERWPEAQIVNPFRPVGEISWAAVMILDCGELKHCHMIFLHPEWRNAPGCRIEEAVAEHYGLDRVEMVAE